MPRIRNDKERCTSERKTSGWRLAGALGVGVVLGVAFAGAAFAVQGHMLNARADLYAARQQLSVAIADKGGYRVNAISLIDQAIGEVNAGFAAGAEYRARGGRAAHLSRNRCRCRSASFQPALMPRG